MTQTLVTLSRCVLAGGLALAMSAPLESACAKERETVLHAFTEESDGGFPNAGLLADGHGNFYGTTERGGGSTNCQNGCGTVFKLTSGGSESVLHAFGGSGGDGAYPFAGLISDSAGNLYGTTYRGGDKRKCVQGGPGCGTVFRLAPDGTETILYRFRGGSDGAYPLASLIADKAGNLYGTTSGGGFAHKCLHMGIGCGTVFRLAPDGTETVLYRFNGGKDGGNPYAEVIMDKAGNLYGTTLFGGMYNSGTVFRLAPDGTKTVLSHFANLVGDGPHGGVIEDKAGNLYGTTFDGGGYGFGTVFKITPEGSTTALYTFTGSDGRYPESRLVMDNAGNLYGTTSEGGAGNSGAIFEIAPDGAESVLYSFCSRSNCTDGATPIASLIRDKAGDLYGTALDGGDAGCDSGEGCGVVFRLR